MLETKLKIIGPFEALGRFIAKAFCIKDTAQRSEYWWIVLMSLLTFFFITSPWHKSIINSPACSDYLSWGCTVLYKPFIWFHIIEFIILVIPVTTLMIRRWNDIGLPGILFVIIFWGLFLMMVVDGYFGIGFILFNVFQNIAFCYPSKIKNNPYRNI